MTTLAGRPASALLVVDVQNGVMEGAHDRGRVIANIRDLVDRAREAHVPVVWVQHASDDLPEGSERWQYVAELPRRQGEALVPKRYGDAFEATELERVLAERGVGEVLVAGAATDACVRSTLHGAFVRGYDVTLVGDAHTTGDLSAYGAPTPDLVIAHTNLYWQHQRAPGRRAATVDTAAVRFPPPGSVGP